MGKKKIIAPTKIFPLRGRKATLIRKNERQLGARKLKVKKKKEKKTKLLDCVKEESEIKCLKDVIKLEVEDVLLNQSKVGKKNNPENLDEGTNFVNEEEAQDLRCWRYRGMDNLQILFTYPNQIAALKGSCSVRCIHGQIEINGKLIDTSNEPIDVLSEEGSSLLCLEDAGDNISLVLDDEAIKCLVSNIKEDDETLLKPSIERDLIGFLEELDGEISSCVLIKKTSPTLFSILKHLNDYKPTQNLEIYKKPYPGPILRTNNWKNLINNLNEKKENNFPECVCSMMICGGKDVGKSSFARYAINNMLNKHDAVFFLECDCGQTEFTPPGVLSLVKINKPLLGPPFLHMTTPIRSVFFGHISPKDTPTEYISIIESLLNTYVDIGSSFGPLIINQQGWVKGLGISLLVDCIRITNPCFIMQIHSEQESRNLPQMIDDEYLDRQAGWSVMNTFKSTHKRQHERQYFSINSEKLPTNIQKSKGLTARNLSITAYFSNLFNKSRNAVKDEIPPSLASIQPYAIRFCDIALHVIHEKVSHDLLLYAFNESIVCLSKVSQNEIINPNSGPCYLGDEPKEFEYYGLGIVRNIDPVKRIIYLITPEPIDVLQNVNVLVKGNIQMPQTYLTHGDQGSHPYYCYDYDSCTAKGSSVMKPRFNLKRKPSRMWNTFGER